MSHIPGKLHITIGAGLQIVSDAPSGITLGSYQLERQFQLVKVALLYGDNAKVYSPFLSLVLRFLQFENEPLRRRLDFLKYMAERSPIGDDEPFFTVDKIERYRSIARKSYPNGKQRQFKIEFEEMRGRVQELPKMYISGAAGEGLMDAIKAGLLDVHYFAPSVKVSMEQMSISVREFLILMREVISDASTYPLFDTVIGDFIGESIRGGFAQVSDSGGIRGKQVGLAAHLLERLPVFDLATVREILDIRRELEKPLINFRAGIIGFADSVKNAQWDTDFAFESDQVFQREVAPSVLALEEAIEDNKYLKVLIRKATDKPLSIPTLSATPVLGAALSQASAIPAIAAQALTVGAMAGAAATFYRAYEEMGQNQRKAEQNQLYFYYSARERLQALP